MIEESEAGSAVVGMPARARTMESGNRFALVSRRRSLRLLVGISVALLASTFSESSEGASISAKGDPAAFAQALATLQDGQATPEQKAAAGAVFTPHNLSLTVAGGTLKEAFVQLFAKAAMPITIRIDPGLNAPTSLTITDVSFATALAALRRLARRNGQPVVLRAEGNTVVVEMADSQPNALLVTEEWPIITSDPRFRYQKTVTRPVLDNFLSRAVTHFGLLASSPEEATPCFEDDLRMLTHIGAKFIGRSAYAWAPPGDDDAHFAQAVERARRVHQADPEVVLEAAIFGTAYRSVEAIVVPEWVFAEFGLPVEKRNFRYENMLYGSGKFRDHWMHDASVPDMSKRETQMWFYYRARRYIAAGCESIHFGQIALMNQADPGNVHWRSLLARIRRYAAAYGRRRMVWCSSNPDSTDEQGRLMFDFHCWPTRPAEVPSPAGQERAELRVEYGDSIYRRSQGGITPSGWACDSLPYLVEIDNWASCGKQGQANVGFPWVWGYDEISWFAHQSESARNDFLRYAHSWIRRNDPSGHLQAPTRRVLADGVPGTNMYQANSPSTACPKGFNQEDALREIFRT